MSSALTLQVRQQQGTRAVLALAGDLDLGGGDTLTAAAAALIEAGHRDLVLEMAQVAFCDSMGLNALLRILRQAMNAGGSLVLLSPTDPIKRLLSMCGVDQIISTLDGPTRDGAAPPLG
ncbi:STAS domain-containing protein [Streptacidiphilus sp. PAMC 29251]